MRTVEFKQDRKIAFVFEKECLSGIIKIADKVADDICLVFGKRPECLETSDGADPDFAGIKVVFGIAGHSPMIGALESAQKIDLSAIRGKREVYGFFAPKEDCIVIAGSDKRGTIYGLFRLSELFGVSPFVNWSGLLPQKRDCVLLNEEVFTVSKEPSVEYRGFFINDEWPAFGTWCNKHFGGFTCEMYEGVFELLLRLKGNYLWPAMWTSSFAEDGPGLKSAELADELGVVMGLSHHEPCLRHGEEYSHVRGKDSIYGDAWNFRSNEEGITLFWRDGLRRNGHLENVITVGMRGERDSKILGKEASLEDNINLLRDVLKTQEKLIREEVNEDLSKVPRMLALYKEVEAYYYGDKDTAGLIEGCPELEDVILLLCEDNHGYLRSLPDEKMRRHPGGFGMYYHFDYHGDPVSFEWIDSTYLPEVWQQMSTAYEYGIQKLWIVNVGDLAFQELPLSYFLNLAYDYEKWGAVGPGSAGIYLHEWMEKQFGHAFNETEIRELSALQMQGSRLIHNRRPEHLSDAVYRPQNDYESWRIADEAGRISDAYQALEEKCSAEYRDALYELIGYSLLAGMNLIRMWILCGMNHYFAGIGAVIANTYAEQVKEALQTDLALKDRLQSSADRKWDGFAEAPHIGFTNWNCEESRKPVLHQVLPVSGSSITAGLMGDPGETHGMDWSKKALMLRTYREEDAAQAKASFFVALCGDNDSTYVIETDREWIAWEGDRGVLTPAHPLDEIKITVDKIKAGGAEGKILIRHEEGCIEICVKAPQKETGKNSAYREANGMVVIDADNFERCTEGKGASLQVFPELGRRESAIGLIPFTAHFDTQTDAPFAEYSFCIDGDSDYTLIFQMLPTNSYRYGTVWKLMYSIDDGEVKCINAIRDDHLPGESKDWADGVLSHKRDVTDTCRLESGEHRLKFYGTDAENVLERILLIRKDREMPGSYLGPAESRRN